MSTPEPHIRMLKEDLIFWQPHNPQGDIVGTRADTKEILRLAKKCPVSASLLIDLSRAEMPNLEQKKAVAQAGRKYKFKKIAVYGFNWRLKLVVDFIVKLVGKVNVQLFESREAAEDWLGDKEV